MLFFGDLGKQMHFKQGGFVRERKREKEREGGREREKYREKESEKEERETGCV